MKRLLCGAAVAAALLISATPSSAQVVNLTNLQLFNVSYNRLCGAVPTGGNMASFDAYSYQHNRCLCGPPLADPCK